MSTMLVVNNTEKMIPATAAARGVLTACRVKVTCCFTVSHRLLRLTIVENTYESYSPSGIEKGSLETVKDIDVFLKGGVASGYSLTQNCCNHHWETLSLDDNSFEMVQ